METIMRSLKNLLQVAATGLWGQINENTRFQRLRRPHGIQRRAQIDHIHRPGPIGFPSIQQ